MGIGDTIKDVLGSGEHSEAAARGEVDHRTPGSFPYEEHAVKDTFGVVPRAGVDQPHMGNKPIPSSGKPDLGGTAEDPILAGKSHNVLHKKNDPRGHAHTDSGIGLTEFTHERPHEISESTHDHPQKSHESSSHTTSGTFGHTPLQHEKTTGPFSHDDANRSVTAGAVGTGVAAAGAGGLAAHELGGDRSGQKSDATTLPGSTTIEHSYDPANHSATAQSKEKRELPGAAGFLGLSSKDHNRDDKPTSTEHRSVTKSDSAGTTGLASSTSNNYNREPTTTSTGGLPASTSNNTFAPDPSTTTSSAQTRGSDHSTSHGLGVGVAGAAAGAGTAGAVASHEAHNRDHDDGQKSDTRNNEPYWGNLPQGVGTYNTVTGHGSNEDPTSQHRTIPGTGASEAPVSTSETRPQGTGIYNTVTGHGSTQDESLRSHHPLEADKSRGDTHSHGTGIYNTVTGHGSAHDDSSRSHPHHELDKPTPGTGATTVGHTGAPAGAGQSKASALDPSQSSIHPDTTEKDKSSSTGKHIAEAGAAAGVGASVQKVLHHNKDDKDEKNKGAVHEEPTGNERKSETGKHAAEAGAGSGIGAAVHKLFHRNKDDKEDKTKVADQQDDLTSKHHHHDAKHGDSSSKQHHHVAKHDTKIDREHTTTESPVSTSDNKHISKHSHEPTAATSGSGATDDLQKDSSQSHDHRAAAGLAGVGAGGAAAYGVSKLAQRDDNKNDVSRQAPASTSTAPSYTTSGLSGAHPSTTSEISPSGTSGAYQSHSTDAKPSAFTGSHPTTVSDVSTSGLTEHNLPKASHTTSADHPGSSSVARDTPVTSSNDSHTKDYTTGLVGAGVGAGAAYGASKFALDNEPKDANSNIHSNTGESQYPSGPRTTEKLNNPSTFTAADEGSYNKLSSGTASGVQHEAGRAAPSSATTGNDVSYNTLATGTPSGLHSDHQESSTAGNSGKITVPSASTGDDNGPYNTLSSGTPSGIHIGNKAHTTAEGSSHGI